MACDKYCRKGITPCMHCDAWNYTATLQKIPIVIFSHSNISNGCFSRGLAISWAIVMRTKLGQILSLGFWGKDIQTRCRPMIPRWPSWLWPSLTEDSSEVWSVEGPSGAVFSSRRLVATTIGCLVESRLVAPPVPGASTPRLLLLL